MTPGTTLRIISSISILVLLLVGCSGGGMGTSPETETPAGDVEQPLIEPSDARTGAGGRSLLGLWELDIDYETLTVSVQPMRAAQPHYDITKTLQPPYCDDCLKIQVNFFDKVSRMMDVDVTLKNPYPIAGRDIRGILFTNSAGHSIINPDAWTGLYDIPGGLDINPFMAFGKNKYRRIFGGLQSLTQKYYVYIPTPPQLQAIKFAADGSWIANIKEPYAIENFEQSTSLYDFVGSQALLEVDVLDWQDDVIEVSLIAPNITNVPSVPFTHIAGNRWGVTITNNTGTQNGYHDIQISATSPNPGNYYLHNFFSINVGSIDPVVTGIQPTSGTQASTLNGVTISGTSFQGPGATVKLKMAGQPDLVASNVLVVSGFSITCDITIPLNTQLGLWDVEVVNGNQLVAVGTQMFEILCAQPTVNAAIPNTAPFESYVTGLLISGENFVGPNAQVRFRKTGYTDVLATNVVVMNSQTITCDIDIVCSMTGGNYDIEVANSCGTSGVGQNVFSVYCPTPGFLSIVPPVGSVGTILNGMDITGADFVCSDAVVTLKKNGAPDISLTNVTVTSPTSITADLIIPLGSDIGFYGVEITNDCGETYLSPLAFEVICPTPIVSGVSIPAADAGTSVVSQIVSGDNFKGPNVQVVLKKAFAPDISASSVVIQNEQTLSCDFTLPIEADMGFYDVEVTTGCGETASAAAVFEVTCPLPTITNINPVSWASFPANLINDAYITGTGFLGCGGVTQVYLDNGNVQIYAYDLVVVNDTTLTCDFNIDAYPYEPGLYDVVVVTVTLGRGDNLFTVYETLLFEQDFSLGDGGCTGFGTHGGYTYTGQWWDSYAPAGDPYPIIMFSAFMTPVFDVPAYATDVHFLIVHSIHTDILEGAFAGWTNNGGGTIFGSACNSVDRWIFENGQPYNGDNIFSPINEGMGSYIGCFQVTGWSSRYWLGNIGTEGGTVVSQFHTGPNANLIGMSGAQFIMSFLSDSYVSGSRGHELATLKIWYDAP